MASHKINHTGRRAVAMTGVAAAIALSIGAVSGFGEDAPNRHVVIPAPSETAAAAQPTDAETPAVDTTEDEAMLIIPVTEDVYANHRGSSTLRDQLDPCETTYPWDDGAATVECADLDRSDVDRADLPLDGQDTTNTEETEDATIVTATGTEETEDATNTEAVEAEYNIDVPDNHGYLAQVPANGAMLNNYGTVMWNGGTIVNNYGEVHWNSAANGTNGTVVNNYGTVVYNSGYGEDHVTATDSTIVNNYGEVTNIPGTIVNDYTEEEPAADE